MKTRSLSNLNEEFSRRDFMCCGALLFAGLLGAPGTASALNFKEGLSNPCEGERAWTSAERDFIDAAFAGINASNFIDIHSHLLGTGDSGSGCHVHESLYSIWQPIEFLRRKQILSGACVKEPAGDIDRQYVTQLTRMMNDFPAGAKAALLAFDHAHDDRGTKDLDKSTFHVPNAYAKTVAQTHAPRFEWIASVHPYRDDSVAAIAKARADGAVAVKWLPSAMNIDWRDARLVRVYDYLAQTQMPLIAHFGAEKAVKGAHRDEFLNPLHARVPLEHGVRLIVAHAASMGNAPDLESMSKRSTPCFDLFARLMNDRAYERHLLADTSAVFFCNRDASVWQQMLRNTHWHSRLLHGTDHPLPGVWPLYDVEALVDANVLNADAAPTLKRIRRKNPLLFDFVLKRSVRFGGSTFSASVFEARRHIAQTG
ncbi:MAG: amidohydrolase [Betaproteobacteria bacterium]|nr:MAG: amidohydrolase [Betaproteobacteria bacterium]